MWLLVPLLLVIALASAADVSDDAATLRRCCDVGVTWRRQSRERCTRYPTPLQEVAPHIYNTCRHLLQICCLEERSRQQCSAGRTLALAGRGCRDLYVHHNNLDERKCCHCCAVGVAARAGGRDCAMLRSYTHQQCADTARECCEQSTPALAEEPAGEDGGSQPDSLVSDGTVSGGSAGSVNGMCELYLGQLCDHVCRSTTTSYSCSCHHGFRLAADQRTCRQMDLGARCSAYNPCNQVCVDGDRDVRCRCFPGWRLAGDGRTCQDKNECALGTSTCGRDQRCINLPGGFRCHTHRGAGSWETTVITCALGSVYDPDRRSCVAASAGPHERPQENCGPGFTYNTETGICDDVNECALSLDNCASAERCENTIGSFSCRRRVSCGTGYTLDQATQGCVDDDECALALHNCGPAYTCQNTEGSFRCDVRVCEYGTRLDFNTGRCAQVICELGMRPDEAANCVDVDECATTSPCTQHQECHNTVGSYSCRNFVTCGPGFTLNAEGSACADVNECTASSTPCADPRMTCINTPGAHVCECPLGFSLDRASESCRDVDECARRGVCSRNARCLNTVGSYRCRCNVGFEAADDTGLACDDVDECQMASICDHTCRNTYGSYVCRCRHGWELAPDARSCQDIDECAHASARGGTICIGLCLNTPGSYECVCPDGYLMLGDGRSCQDIDECAAGEAACYGPDDICVNTRGGYKCQNIQCPAGFVKAPTASSGNNVRCQRQTFVCRQGDAACLTAPVSYSVNFLTFPDSVRTPAELFTMRGPLSPYRRLEFQLLLKDSRDPRTGVSRVTQDMFYVKTVAPNEVVLQLLKPVDGPQDVELELNMKIYSTEFNRLNNGEDMYFGNAVAKIFLFITGNDW